MSYGSTETPLAVQPARDVSKWRAHGRVAAAVVGTCILGAALSFLPAGPDADLAELAAASSKVSLTVENDYERASGRRIGDGLYPFDYVAAVYTPTTLKAVASEGVCSWSIRSPSQALSTYTGCEITHSFTEVGTHKALLSLDGVQDSLFDIMAKYVRREIRSMTEDDRSSMLEALHTLYHVGQEEGVSKYGQKYRSAATLLAKHLEGAADKSCDHWHDDAGIVTHHMAFTLEAEQSMQAVNPAVAMCYWDYTIDAHEFADSDWAESPIFRDDWFGEASPSNSLHIVDSGRWAHTPVERMAGEHDSRIHNPYGLLRSPWNTNPTPYVLRHRYVLGAKDGFYAGLPGCDKFKEIWSKDKLAEWSSALNGILHGPVHIMIGGQWHWVKGANDLEKMFTELSRHYYKNLGHGIVIDSVLLASKILWREGLLRCPKLCGADTPAQECTCSCAAEELGLSKFELFIEKGKMYELFMGLEDMIHGNITTLDRMYDVVCQVGWAGDLFTSAAPQDPLFWPIHGTAEKYLQLKRLYKAMGLTDFFEAWSYEHEDIASDTHLVCDWSNVTSEAGLPDCAKGTCPGHRASDVIPFWNFTGDDSSYTNLEFYKFMSPANPSLPYFYDSLTHWPGCEDQNITWW